MKTAWWYGGSSPQKPIHGSSPHGPGPPPNMLRPMTVAPTFSKKPSTIALLALTSPPVSPCISRKALSGKIHSWSCIPPMPIGFSALCSGPAAYPSSETAMFSFSLLMR
jgi:hypothetical protein